MLAVTNKNQQKLNYIANKDEQSIFTKTFKFLLNWNTEEINREVYIKCAFKKPLKCTEFVPYTLDFADSNTREGPLLNDTHL